MNTNVSPSIFSLLSDYKSKISLSTALEIIATIIGLIPFIVVYRLAIALFNPPILQSSAWQLIAVALIAVVIKWVLIAIAGSLSHIVAYDVLYDVRRKISDKFGVLPLGYFDKHSTGELKKIMNEDVEYLELTIAHGIPEVIGLLSTLVITSI
ncbi:MAG: ABC transporter transmembrane domain-containing protein, partial [Pleurocapsa sp. MO_226.B13]|nr:ABC transporter transmembrane domain-containing protein [Pleurocapsa sp. MO_226.B13]